MWKIEGLAGGGPFAVCGIVKEARLTAPDGKILP